METPALDISDQCVWEYGEMTGDGLRATLARNLRKKIERDQAVPSGGRISVRAWALGKELDVRLIDRLLKGQHAITLDKLDELAAACGLQPWQLLLDDLDPSAPPDAPISDEERAMLRRLRRLLGPDLTP